MAYFSLYFGPYFDSGETVNEAPYRETPAGRKRRKYAVEIDGQTFVTESLDEARSLLERARAIAEPKAMESARLVVEKAIRRAKRVAGIQKPKIQAPPELREEVRAVRKVYDDALRDAEIALLLALKAEQDDEEALLLLI